MDKNNSKVDASLTLSIEKFEEKIVEIESQIEQATSRIFDLEPTLDKIIHEACKLLGFDFATIQLIRPEEQIIEAVRGSTQWAGRARHYIEPDSNLRDIQADICQTCRTEAISGWDNYGRFDEWVYKEYRHESLTRIFTPIILLQDDHGKNDEQWFNHFQWKLIKHEISPEWFNPSEANRIESNGQHSIIEIFLPDEYKGKGYEVKIIGTIEVGFRNTKEPVKAETMVELIKQTGKWALDIRRSQLPCVLEAIAKNAMKAVKADGSSLHFVEGFPQKTYIHEVTSEGSIKQHFLEDDAERIPYIYEVFSGLIGRSFLRKSPPRKMGLGQEAIAANEPRFMPDFSKGHEVGSLEHYNPQAFSIGIKAIGAFPLIVNHQKGVLYFHFKHENPFSERVKNWLNLFDNRVEDAIRHSITYEHTRDKADQLMALHSVGQSLANMPDEKDLLNRIAWNTLNVLAADTITIYKYIQAEDQFPPPPATAGRLKFQKEAQLKIDEHDVPSKLIKYGKSVYSPEEKYKEIFKDSSFSERENIKSTAGVLLKVSNQIVGTLFVNYRRHHIFAEDEKRIIETLAASAAIAIKNQQWLEALSDIDRKIKTALDLDELLALIMRRSVQLTGANLADIRLLDLVNQELVMRVWHPEDASKASLIRTKLGEGITGWVAQNKVPALVLDATTDSRYKTYFERAGSELCVPLMNGGDLLGVINLECYEKEAFTQRHLLMLEALADQAVIAMRNKEQLVKMRTLASLATITSALIHRMSNDAGAIRVWAEDILDEGDEKSRDRASQIISSTDQILSQAYRMRTWIRQEDKQRINLRQAVQNALIQIGDIPTNISQRIELPADLPEVLGGEQQLTDIFDNLIRNAIDAMPNGGTLSIDGRVVENATEFSIEVLICDTGVGIAEEDHKMIFQPGYSMQDSKHGMGIGLWWVQAYLESLGNRITFESKLGDGSRFTVIFPIKKLEDYLN
jgi:signal transduction histidine kinase